MDSTALVTSVRQLEAKLADIWQIIGVTPEERTVQLQKLHSAIAGVMNERLEIEQSLLDEYRTEITRLMEDIRICADRIDRPDLAHPPLNKNDSLIAQLTMLRGRYEEIDVIKTRLLEEIDGYLEEYHEICKEMGTEIDKQFREAGHKLGSGRAEICKDKLREAKLAKSNRIRAAQKLIAEAVRLLQDLEITPITELDKELVQRNGESLGFSDNVLGALSVRVKELNGEKDRRTLRIKELADHITGLWERLEISQAEQTEFLSKNEGLGEKVILACEEELSRLEALEKQKIGELTERAFVKLRAVWKEMHLSDEQMNRKERLLHQVHEDLQKKNLETSAKLFFSYLEDAIDKAKVLLESMQTLFEMADQYTELVRERDEYDLLIQDSSRLLSRQRTAAKAKEEELMGNRVKIVLPKLVEKLRNKIVEYNNQTNETFTIKGVDFLKDIVEVTENSYKERQAKAKEEKKHRSTGSSSNNNSNNNNSSTSDTRNPLSQYNRKGPGQR